MGRNKRGGPPETDRESPSSTSAGLVGWLGDTGSMQKTTARLRAWLADAESLRQASARLRDRLPDAESLHRASERLRDRLPDAESLHRASERMRDRLPDAESLHGASARLREWWSDSRSLARRLGQGSGEEADPASAVPPAPPPGKDQHLDLARESLHELLSDRRVPDDVRTALAVDYQQIQAMLEKLEHGHLHISVFGRVSVGKSATLNALLGNPHFRTSPLHGETRRVAMARWEEYDAGGVFLIDTPGINEVGGEDREAIAREVAGRSDLVLFVVDGDITHTEIQALRDLAAEQRPILLVLNKADRYTGDDRRLLLQTLSSRTVGLVNQDNIVTIAAEPAERVYLQLDEQGRESETRRRPPPDVMALKDRLWEVLEAEGKSLAALNAGLFAGQLSERVAERILATRRHIGARVVRTYSISKGVAVAINPLPVADLLAAAVVDVGMVVHLSRVYNLSMTRSEAGGLVKTIAGQMALLMGTTWAIHLVSSALKIGTAGLSTLVTAGAQGAVAYYSTYVVGRAAEQFLAQGLSWGEAGPKRVVRDILASIDRDSLLAQAKEDILARLRAR